MTLVLLLIACGDAGTSGLGPAGVTIARGLAAPPGIPGAEESEVVAEPMTLEFGTLVIGETKQVEVELRNGGPRPVEVVGIETYAEGLSATSDAFGTIPPWGALTVAVEWVPAELELSALVTINLRYADGAETALRLKATGDVRGASEMEVTVRSFEDLVGVGCEAVQPVEVTNVGGAPMTVDSVAMGADTAGFSVTETTGEPVATPFVLAGGKTRALQVQFRPTHPGVSADELQVVSDAFANGVAAVPVEAEAAGDHAEAEDFVVSAPDAATVLVAVNGEAATLARAHIQGLIEALFETGADWRMALLTEASGEVTGGTPYIDPSMSVSDAVDAAMVMLLTASGDDDALLAMLEAGLAVNVDWAADTAPEWSGAPVHLVGVNADQEQSSGSVTGYVTRMVSTAGSAHPVVVDAIAGVPPKGCSEDALEAEPSQMLYDAATATHGHFQSWCDPWEEGLEALASSFALTESSPYTLLFPARPETIVLSLDGVETDVGWTFDTATNGIVFDADSRPAVGTTIHVEYTASYPCDGA